MILHLVRRVIPKPSVEQMKGASFHSQKVFEKRQVSLWLCCCHVVARRAVLLEVDAIRLASVGTSRRFRSASLSQATSPAKCDTVSESLSFGLSVTNTYGLPNLDCR